MSEIENRGSTARDHLANERTFLAWVRTALGVIGLGVILEKIVDDHRVAITVAGAVLIGYGALMLGYALTRYERVRSRLQAGHYVVARHGPALVGVVGLLVALGALVLVLR